VGGRTSLAYSLCWTRALRPIRYAAMRASQHSLPARALAFATRPLCAIADSAVAPRSRKDRARLARSSIEPFDATRHLPELSEILERWALRPLYDAESFPWVLRNVEARRKYGELRSLVVRDTKG